MEIDPIRVRIEIKRNEYLVLGLDRTDTTKTKIVNLNLLARMTNGFRHKCGSIGILIGIQILQQFVYGI